MEALCAQAKDAGAELVVFPEAFVGGYPKGLDFGARLGSRTPQGRDDFRRYWEASIEVPGPETQRIGEMAAAMNAVIVVGVIERGPGTLYCCALTFGSDGELLAKHRKLMPTALERLIWGCGDGSSLTVTDTPCGRLGAAICWENYMPMLRYTLYAQNVELWCAPTVDDRDVWQSSMRHIAVEGRCFVLCACQYLTLEDCPADYTGVPLTPGGALIRGGSTIVSPLGEVLAGPVYGKECVLTASIDLDDTIRGKYDLDVTGHYARPDVFELRVNRARQKAVEVQQPD